MYVQERMKECLTLRYIPFHVLTKILYVSLLIINYLIGLVFWAFLIGFWYVAWSGTKMEQIRHIRIKFIIPSGVAIVEIRGESPLLEKYMFVSHTKHMQRKINGSTSFAIDNICYVSFRI